MAKKKSIVTDPERRECYLCMSPRDLEWHHIIHGTANRKISDKYGLAVWLCHGCHEALHSSPDELWRVKDHALMAAAQTKFEHLYGHDKWMELFRKNYVTTQE